MVALRNLALKIFACFAFIAMFAPAAEATCGNCGYGYGYYSQYYARPAWNWAWGTGCATCGYGYRPAYVNPGYPYAAPRFLDPADYYQPYPRRYFVNQGPVYGGPNVSVFAPSYYDPGYVATRAFPYVGGYGYRTPYMDPYARVYRPYRPNMYRPYARYRGAKVIQTRW